MLDQSTIRTNQEGAVSTEGHKDVGRPTCLQALGGGDDLRTAARGHRGESFQLRFVRADVCDQLEQGVGHRSVSATDVVDHRHARLVGHSGQDGVDALRDFALEQKCRCATHTTSQCTRALVRPVIVTAAKHDRGDSASILEHRDALARGARLRMCAGIETQTSRGKNALHSLCVRVVAEVTHELADRAVRRSEPCGCNGLIRTLAA